MATYEELKRKRNELQASLSTYSDLKGHRTYKKLEDEIHNVKKQIKQLFRTEHQRKNG